MAYPAACKHTASRRSHWFRSTQCKVIVNYPSITELKILFAIMASNCRTISL